VPHVRCHVVQRQLTQGLDREERHIFEGNTSCGGWVISRTIAATMDAVCASCRNL
jgi:hypothetical protein